MPSLNLDPGYPTHPKTRRLVQLLGRGGDMLPIRLWAYCAINHRADGRLAGYTAEALESLLEWTGKAGVAVAALLNCGQHIGKAGFLEEIEGGGFQVHDWAEHEGHLEAYHQAAKAAAEKRWEKFRMRADSNAKGNADSNADRTAVRNAPAVQCSAVQCSAGEEGGEAPPEPPPARVARPAEAGAIGAYRTAWARRYGLTPNPSAADCKSANAALKGYPDEERIAIVEAFVADDDPWLVKRTHRLGLLAGQLDGIRARLVASSRDASTVVAPSKWAHRIVRGGGAA